MPINFKLDDDAGCTHDILRRWEHDGHEVAVIRHGRLNDPEHRRTEMLVCECDYEVIMEDGGGAYSHRNDPAACTAKSAARANVSADTAVGLRAMLSLNGLEAAILEAHHKVEAGAYLGQTHAGMLYVQEIAELLGKPSPEVFAATQKLRAEEKLDLDGMILIPFVPHFRFPEEMRMMIRLMVETPLGWPNGDAGGCAIETLEKAIDEGTVYKHGGHLFWGHNYPNIAPNHLLDFGMRFIAAAIDRAEGTEAERNDLRYTDCERVAGWLEAVASRFRTFGSTNGFPMAFSPDDATDAAKAASSTRESIVADQAPPAEKDDAKDEKQ